MTQLFVRLLMALLTLVTLWLLMALTNIAMIGFWSENSHHICKVNNDVASAAPQPRYHNLFILHYVYNPFTLNSTIPFRTQSIFILLVDTCINFESQINGPTVFLPQSSSKWNFIGIMNCTWRLNILSFSTYSSSTKYSPSPS